MAARPLLTPLNERADRSRRGIKHADLVSVNHAPETVRLWEVGRALIHYGSRAVLQRAINDVAVTCHPANIGAAPVRVFVLEIEDPLRRYVSADGIPAGGVYHAFRFAGCAGGVQDVERVFGVQRFGRTDPPFLFPHQLVPPMIAA